MKTLRLLLVGFLVIAPIAPALALDRVLPAPRIKDNGDVRLSDDLKIGKFQGGKFISKPDGLDGLALTSPLPTDAYASGRTTGEAAFVLNSADSHAQIVPPGEEAKERYGTWIAYTGKGTANPAVIASHFGLGISSLKENWFNSTVPGQTIGAQIITRGGYHGPLANTAPPEFGGYYPGGDVTGLIMNSVQASKYAQQAAMELSIHYAENGRFDASGDIHSMNVQVAPMRQRHPDGSVANPGIGLSLTASAGSLGYAIQAINTARPGSFNNNTPGFWGGFLNYNLDDGGTRAPFKAFAVEQDGSISMSSGYPTAPKKTLRVGNDGSFQVQNNVGSPVFQLSDSGLLLLGAGANAKAVLTEPGTWTSYNGSLQFDANSTAAGTYNGRYEITGKRLTLTTYYNVTTTGAAPGGSVRVPLPPGTSLKSFCTGSGSEFAAAGKGLQIRGMASETRLTALNADGASPVVATAQGIVSVTCEIQ